MSKPYKKDRLALSLSKQRLHKHVTKIPAVGDKCISDAISRCASSAQRDGREREIEKKRSASITDRTHLSPNYGQLSEAQPAGQHRLAPSSLFSRSYNFLSSRIRDAPIHIERLYSSTGRGARQLYTIIFF